MKKQVRIGSWLTIGHFAIAELMADAGFDWLCIDLEHTSIDYTQAAQLILAIQSKGIKAFVRVGANDALIIKRVLDAGADGIIVPMVCTKEEAVNAVNAVKYPPQGKRGVGLNRAQKYGFGFDDYKNNIAPTIELIAQIEHIDAINNLESIIEVEGIDGTFIGPYDLSGSMGKPGRWEDEDVKAALERYETIGKKYDKFIGFHVVPTDYKLVEEKILRGYNFIAFGFDALFLGTKVREELSQLPARS
jgi:2-dehydro-3-deoxyglucarate aldolase